MGPNTDSIDEKTGTDRRTFVGLIGLTGTATLAGCSELGPSDTANDDEDGGNNEKSGSVAVYEDLTYAERDAGEMKLDLYVPEVDDPPLVVYVHGGGWVFETRENVPDGKRYAAEWGCAIASVSYRLAEVPDDVNLPFPIDPDNPTPRGTFPDQIVDVKASIRWLRANADDYGYDAETVATWGASAGGHLASLAGVVDDVESVAGDVYPPEAVEKEVAVDESGAVQAVANWYGITNLLELPGGSDSVESLLIGGPVSENQREAERASPTTYVSQDSPPFLIMHGRPDQVVSVEQSRILFDALAEAHVDAVRYELHDLGHVWGEDSERTAMDGLAVDPTPAQSISETVHLEEGGSPVDLIGEKTPAGPESIERFLERTIM